MAGPLQKRIGQFRSSGGVLAETSDEELRTLAGKAGLQAPPTDPISATTIGAGPHQAKMAAAPQTVQAAMRLSSAPPEEGLAAAQRRQQSRTESSETEAEAQARAEKLKALGSTGEKVQSLIDAEVARITSQAPVVPQVNTQAIPQQVVGAGQQDAFTQALTTLASDPTNQEALAQVNAALGRGPNNPVTAEELQMYYQSLPETVSSAADIRDSIQVADLDLGVPLADLAEALGIPEEELAGYNASQLSQAMNAAQAGQFSTASRLDQQATSSSLGAAERATARELGREAATTGTRASEADVERLALSVEEGQLVEFGGELIQVGDLLGSERISKTITDYLQAPAGSSTQQQLLQTEPDLVKWIEDNRTALEEASQQLAAGTQQFADTQEANRALSVFGNTQLSDEVMSNLVPGWGELSATELDTSNSAPLQYLRGLPPDQAEKAVTTINQMLTPEQQKELADLTPEEIQSLELDKGMGSPVIRALVENGATRQALENISPNDPDAVYSALFGYPIDSEEAQEIVSSWLARTGLFGAGYGNVGGLDTDRDGVLDPPDQILSRMLSQTPPTSLSEAIRNGVSTFKQAEVRGVDPVADLTPRQRTIWESLSQYFADDRVLSPEELSESGALDNEDLLRTMAAEPTFIRQLSPEVRTTVEEAIRRFNESNTRAVASKAGVPSQAQFISALESAGNPGNLMDSPVPAYENLISSLERDKQNLLRHAKEFGEDRLSPGILEKELARLDNHIRSVQERVANYNRTFEETRTRTEAENKQREIDERDRANREYQSTARNLLETLPPPGITTGAGGFGRTTGTSPEDWDILRRGAVNGPLSLSPVDRDRFYTVISRYSK